MLRFMELNSQIMRKLHKAAVSARKNSHSPYSHYAVGAALLDHKGQIYLGCNVENASYGGCICAERTAFVKAVSQGIKNFKAICIVIDTKEHIIPCGLCLQTIAEFCEPDFQILCATPKKLQALYEFQELLPLSFNPKHLLKKTKGKRKS